MLTGYAFVTSPSDVGHAITKTIDILSVQIARSERGHELLGRARCHTSYRQSASRRASISRPLLQTNPVAIRIGERELLHAVRRDDRRRE